MCIAVSPLRTSKETRKLTTLREGGNRRSSFHSWIWKKTQQKEIVFWKTFLFVCCFLLTSNLYFLRWWQLLVARGVIVHVGCARQHVAVAATSLHCSGAWYRTNQSKVEKGTRILGRANTGRMSAQQRGKSIVKCSVTSLVSMISTESTKNCWCWYTLCWTDGVFVLMCFSLVFSNGNLSGRMLWEAPKISEVQEMTRTDCLTKAWKKYTFSCWVISCADLS